MTLQHFILYFCIVQALPSFANISTKRCSITNPTLNKIEKLYDVQISDFGCNITYDYMNKITEQTSSNSVLIHFGSVDVKIAGHFYPKEKYADFKMDRKIGTGPFTVNRTVEKLGFRSEKITCKVVEGDQILPKRTDRAKNSMSQNERAKATVYALIVECLETQICEQYNNIITHDVSEKAKLEQKIDKTIKDYYEKIEAEKAKILQEKNLQIAINSVFDFGVAMAISKWADSDGIFHVQKIEKEFKYLKIGGNFIARDISFEGLTGFKRTANMVFSHDKNCYTMGTTVRLSKAKVNIPYYYAKYAFKEIEGHLKVDINGLSLKIQISVDYNAATCKVHLDEMSIHEIGDVDVDFVGLGFVWDKLGMEPMIRYTVRNYIFEKAKDVMAEQATKLNCETFRPTFELANSS